MQDKEIKKSPDYLITDYLNGELTSDKTKELIEWIKSDSVNKKFFDECCEIWITSKASSGHQGYIPQVGFWKFKQIIKSVIDMPATSKKIRLLNRVIRYAAVFIIAFSLGGLLFYFTGSFQSVSEEQTFSEFIVPLGSRAQIILNDRTSVFLNAGSKLKYDNRYGINNRIVELEGEGYFKVAKDDDWPFIVETSHLNIVALGTEFNVKAYTVDNTIEATLVTGSIKVEHGTGNTIIETKELKPNQKITYYKEDSRLVDMRVSERDQRKKNVNSVEKQMASDIPKLVAEDINIEPVISWKENRWIFEKQTLEQIAIDLERRFDIQIIFESERLKFYRFSGIILAEPIEQVLEVISLSAPISYRLKGNVVTLKDNENLEMFSKNLYKCN